MKPAAEILVMQTELPAPGQASITLKELGAMFKSAGWRLKALQVLIMGMGLLLLWQAVFLLRLGLEGAQPWGVLGIVSLVLGIGCLVPVVNTFIAPLAFLAGGLGLLAIQTQILPQRRTLALLDRLEAARIRSVVVDGHQCRDVAGLVAALNTAALDPARREKGADFTWRDNPREQVIAIAMKEGPSLRLEAVPSRTYGTCLRRSGGEGAIVGVVYSRALTRWLARTRHQALPRS